MAEGSDDVQVASPIRELGKACVMRYLRKKKAQESLFLPPLRGVVRVLPGPFWKWLQAQQ